jgi:hypothetical protein
LLDSAVDVRPHPLMASAVIVSVPWSRWLLRCAVSCTSEVRRYQDLPNDFARLRVGRILLHLLAMLGDRCIRFHVAGIIRELPWLAAALMLLGRTRTRLIGAPVLYFAQPIQTLSSGNNRRSAITRRDS